MTDLERVSEFLETAERYIKGLREDVASLSEGMLKTQTDGSLKEHFQVKMGLTDVYLRSAKKLLEKELTPAAECEWIKFRLTDLKAAVEKKDREAPGKLQS